MPIQVFEVACGYALSGVYCKLQRVMLYCIYLLVFCFRFSKWVTAVGSGTLAAFSIAAFIHGFLLAYDKNAGFDLDFAAVYWMLFIFSLFGVQAQIFVSHTFKFRSKARIGMILGSIAVWYIIFYVMGTQGRKFAYKAAEETAIMVCINETDCADTCNLDAHPSLFRSKNDVLWPYMSFNITPKVMNRTTIAMNRTMISMRPRNIALEITTFYHREGLPGPYSTPYQIHSASQMAAIVITGSLLFNTFYFNKFVLSGKARNYDLKSPSFISPGTVMETFHTGITIFSLFLWLLWDLWHAVAELLLLPVNFWFIVAFEKRFQGLGIPEQEGLLAVGQWASWVHLAFAIMVALFCRIAYPDSESHNVWKSNKRERPRQRMPHWLCGIEEAWYLLVVLQEDWADLVAKWKKTRAILGENQDNSMPLDNFTPLDDTIPLDEESGEFLVWEQIRYPERSPETAFLSS